MPRPNWATGCRSGESADGVIHQIPKITPNLIDSGPGSDFFIRVIRTPHRCHLCHIAPNNYDYGEKIAPNVPVGNAGTTTPILPTVSRQDWQFAVESLPLALDDGKGFTRPNSSALTYWKAVVIVVGDQGIGTAGHHKE